jgi:alkylation response protein AidB-like acyl-CoA dehydrogenase
VEVKPIVFLTGEHIQNEVFFDQVRVPETNVVGRVGEGWTAAKALLQAALNVTTSRSTPVPPAMVSPPRR